MFEQSGTFKNEFKKLGYDAVDLDIQNNFGETDENGICTATVIWVRPKKSEYEK